MNMCRPELWLILIVLALLSQSVSAAFVPCDAAHAPAAEMVGEPEQTCHDDGPDTGRSLPTSTDHDCTQQCACPPGSLTFSGLAAPGTGLTDMGPSTPHESYRPAPAIKALFRPPIQH